MLKKNSSKQKVIDAAALLFFQQGFHGTTVRDIAMEASVNVSLISYYFKSKQGLFEYAVTTYYENYLQEMEKSLLQTERLGSLERLKQLITIMMEYKQNNLQLTCSIQRELSLDSVFVREMSVTYLAKETHYIRTLFLESLKHTSQKTDHQQFLLMQLKGMLITPYVLHNEWKYQVMGNRSHKLFVTKYIQTVHDWLDFLISQEDLSINVKTQ